MRRQRGRNAEQRHVTVRTDIGAGSGSSAIRGESIVENRANKLHMPKTVTAIAVGNILGVARYDRLNASEIPNLAKRTKLAIRAPSALKNITKSNPPDAPKRNEIMNDNLTQNVCITNPEPMYPNKSATQDSVVLT